MPVVCLLCSLAEDRLRRKKEKNKSIPDLLVTPVGSKSPRHGMGNWLIDPPQARDIHFDFPNRGLPPTPVERCCWNSCNCNCTALHGAPGDMI
ncbi:hypothetical protein Dda_2791 [Drechslerella dactyloides]|uniref:Uncharacterized protein n=1 Tax=Drechslerella dactyloides TaxID=74499 RepID=A0AAD6J2F9_DREDA|nr:hypothetical protein Dda_2791 [Drechslerella dactyloides]